MGCDWHGRHRPGLARAGATASAPQRATAIIAAVKAVALPHANLVPAAIGLLVVAAVATCLSACRQSAPPSPSGQRAEGEATAAQASPRPAAPRATSTPLSAEDAQAAAGAVTAARDAFAAEFGLSTRAIEVLAIEPVTWPDSSLGCPKPGEFYLQVLTPGFRIRLASGDQIATYHTDRRRDGNAHVVRCDDPSPLNVFGPLPEPRLDDLTAPALDRARRDLEARLGSGSKVQLQQLRVAEVGELICPGTPTPAANGPGRVIIELLLQAGGETHLYRAWGDEVQYCGLAGPTARD